MVCIEGNGNTHVVGNGNTINNYYTKEMQELCCCIKIYKNGDLNIIFFIGLFFFILLAPLLELKTHWILITILSITLLWFNYLPSKFPHWFYTTIYNDKVKYCGQTVYFKHIKKYGHTKSYFWYTCTKNKTTKIIHFDNRYEIEYLFNRIKVFKKYYKS